MRKKQIRLNVAALESRNLMSTVDMFPAPIATVTQPPAELTYPAPMSPVTTTVPAATTYPAPMSPATVSVPVAATYPAPIAPTTVAVPIDTTYPAPIVNDSDATDATIELAFNPDITRFPPPIQSDPNPVLTLFQVSSGQATIVDPAKVPTTPPLAPPQATLPPLPPPLPTTLPSLPSFP